MPYVIDPNGRWASTWADWHGWIAGADSVVYGEYSFVDNAKREQKPDRLRISPETDQVPMLPLGPKIAPLLHWDFPDRIVPIDALCTGHAQRFLRDGKRLFLAIVGLQAFAAREYISAERALADAETSQDDDEMLFTNQPKDDDSQCDRVPASKSQCSGVLAFYLAVLEQRMGHYQIAQREYTYAAEKLNRAAPYVDLAELYALQNQGTKALQALKSAASADSSSILVAATRAEYESQYGTDVESDRESALELERAQHLARMRQPSEYDWIVLCRAEYMRVRDEGLDCRANVPRKGYSNSPDAEVEYGRWLIATHQPNLVEQGITELRRAIAMHPSNIKANYTLALTLARAGSHDPEIQEHYLVALNARAFTDDEFTDQGNAAKELGDFPRGIGLYNQALTINPRFAYAYESLGRLHERQGDFTLARVDLRIAAALHPREHELQEAQAAIPEKIRRQ